MAIASVGIRTSSFRFAVLSAEVTREKRVFCMEGLAMEGPHAFEDNRPGARWKSLRSALLSYRRAAHRCEFLAIPRLTWCRSVLVNYAV